MLIDFEDVYQRCEGLTQTSEFATLVNLFEHCDEIYIVANGGLHYVGSHLATDMSRLIDGKVVHSFDSFGFITSAANDYGYDQVFVRWLTSVASHKDLSKSLILGLSCSGASKNVVDAITWADNNGASSFLIAGADRLPLHLNGLQMEFEYFHTVEVACMILLYELIHRVGRNCPSIRHENLRNVNSPLRM